MSFSDAHIDSGFFSRFSDGDQQAFRTVFNAQLNPLCYFAEKLIGQRQDAEDIVSNAFYKLWQRHQHFTQMAAIRSFLYTTVRNQCLDYIKHRSVVQSAEKHIVYSGNEPGIEAGMYQAELLQLIYREMLLLPEKYRTILEWSLLEEMSTAEIAGRLGQTETYVRVNKSRALVQLRAALRKKKVWDQALTMFVLWQLY